MIGHWNRLAGLCIHPHHLGGPFGIELVVTLDTHLDIGLETGAAHGANIGSHLDHARTSHWNQEGATGIDDHRPITTRPDDDLHILDPLHPCLLHVTEVDSVIYMAVGIHIAPTNRHFGNVNEFSAMFHK